MVGTQVKREITAVCQLWDSIKPIHDKQYKGNPLCVAEEFHKRLPKLGWKPVPDDELGCFKQVYLKGTLVLKFVQEQTDTAYREAGLDQEWRIWRRASPYKKRFIARCYEYYKWRLLFQERVPRLCEKFEECRKAQNLAARFRICDWMHNHGHVKGRTIFFDYDNHGDGWAWFNYMRYRKRDMGRKKSCANRKSMVEL